MITAAIVLSGLVIAMYFATTDRRAVYGDRAQRKAIKIRLSELND